MEPRVRGNESGRGRKRGPKFAQINAQMENMPEVERKDKLSSLGLGKRMALRGAGNAKSVKGRRGRKERRKHVKGEQKKNRTYMKVRLICD